MIYVQQVSCVMHDERNSHLWVGNPCPGESGSYIPAIPPTFVLHYYKAQELNKVNVLVPQIFQGMYTSS